MTLFPLFLKLARRRCLVVGAGTIAEGKIASLLDARARVRVVAPHATPTIAAWARNRRLVWIERTFEPADLERAFLVIAATNSIKVHRVVFREARRRGVLCNAVDEPARCDFYYPAVVRRGDLQIAVSTAGRSPALAQRVRRELEAQYGPEYEAWLDHLGRSRAALFARPMNPEARRRLLHRQASRFAFKRFAAKSVVATSVALVGAGPGDPELLTLKALRVLRNADVVLHDDLVSAEILALLPKTAHVRSVGKRHGAETLGQQAINDLMIRYARQGLAVVRLKGGDPLIFGRAAEEVEALRAAGIEVEIVPGITAAAAAAAAAVVPLTDRRHGSALVLLAGHRCATGGPPDWRALVRLHATIAVYMPGGRYADLARELTSAGLDPATPCVIVSRTSRADQRTYSSTVEQLIDAPDLPAPALLIIGPAPAGASDEPAARIAALSGVDQAQLLSL